MDNNETLGEVIVDELTDSATTQNGQSKKIFNGADLIRRPITEIPVLLEPLFPKVGSIAMVGTSDTGKSTLLRQFALAVCMGDKTFLDWELKAEHKSALYVSTEDDDDATTIMLKRFNDHRNKGEQDYGNIDFIYDIFKLEETITNHVKQNPIDVLIMDAYLDIYSGTNSKNDGGQIRQFLTIYDQLAKRFGFLVIWNHHCKKGTQAFEPGKDNVLGSQSFEAKMRLVMEMRIDLVHDYRRHLCFVKGNYLPPEYKIESYCIEQNKDTLYFKNTGEREPFNNLRKEVKHKADLKKLVLDLKSENNTIREIETKLRSEGYQISKSTVGRFIKDDEKLDKKKDEKKDENSQTSAFDNYGK